jgi:endonuclease/exonuclease/phosphatase family metal-dependent hydrolase
MNFVATFAVLTLNIWGLPDLGFKVLAPLREERVQGICEALKKATAEVVLLQEAWLESDRKMLRTCGYSYYADLNNPTQPLDSGLMILSKWPLEKTTALTYAALPAQFSEGGDGEFLARKGALLTRVLPANRPAYWVGNTHVVSQYKADAQDDYRLIRKAQLKRFASWVAENVGQEPVIIGGDWNTGPQSTLWVEVQPFFAAYQADPQSAGACTLCPPNTMHSTNEGRVDHLMGSTHFAPVSGAVSFADPLVFPDFKISLSDHFGWKTEFGQKGP